MAVANRDIVLVDLDSEPDSSRPPKKPRLGAQPARPLPPLKKPFMEESDDESAASSAASDSERSRGEPAERPEGRAPEEPAPGAGTGRRAGFGARTTPAAPPLAGSPLPGGRTDTEGGGGLTDSEAAAVVLSDLEEAEPSETYANVHAFRKFVKRFGPQKFLERFLPPDVSGESIVQLLLSLGYVPRNLPPRVGAAHYVKLMRLLELAMGRICELRPRLENFWSVAHVLGALRTARNILVITGAGISTSLGIPDFRSSEGFYSKMAALGLEDPQEVFDIRVFHDNPMVFYSIAHMILPPKDVRAPLHRFLTLLQDKGKLLRNYTQNIDNIEANAGLRPEKMVQCHGSLASASCVTCRYQVEGTRLYPALEKGELAYCPRCDKKRLARMRRDDSADDPSFGVMKPDITFFGEDLPRAYHSQHARDLRDCDLLLSIGTSLRVAPVSDMVDKVAPHVPQVLINRDPIPSCNFDVSFLGDCDDTVSYLCDQLGRDWDIDHPDYRSIVGADRRNLQVHGTGEKGVFEVHNRARAAKLAAAAPKPAPGPDLVLLEPELP